MSNVLPEWTVINWEKDGQLPPENQTVLVHLSIHGKTIRAWRSYYVDRVRENGIAKLCPTWVPDNDDMTELPYHIISGDKWMYPPKGKTRWRARI